MKVVFWKIVEDFGSQSSFNESHRSLGKDSIGFFLRIPFDYSAKPDVTIKVSRLESSYMKIVLID